MSLQILMYLFLTSIFSCNYVVILYLCITSHIIIAIVLKLRRLRYCQICVRFAHVLLLKTQLFAMFAMFQYNFNHNSMRSRSIFKIVNYLNNVHFVFQNEFSIVCFNY